MRSKMNHIQFKQLKEIGLTDGESKVYFALLNLGLSTKGPIAKAVTGEAICSTLCAKPKTLPCLSKGTSFCNTVCSDASM